MKKKTLAVVLVKKNEDLIEDKVENYAMKIVNKLRKSILENNQVLSPDDFNIIYNPHFQTTKQFKIANSNDSSFCFIIGEDEFKENLISIKSMSSGIQKKLVLDEKTLQSIFLEEKF